MSKRNDPFLPLLGLLCPGLWLGFKRNKGMLVDRKQILSALSHGPVEALRAAASPLNVRSLHPSIPAHTPSITLVTKLFQQLCYCWSQASVTHTEYLFRRLRWWWWWAGGGMTALGFGGSICSSGPSLDPSARAFPGPELRGAMRQYWVPSQASKVWIDS